MIISCNGCEFSRDTDPDGSLTLCPDCGGYNLEYIREDDE